MYQDKHLTQLTILYLEALERIKTLEAINKMHTDELQRLKGESGLTQFIPPELRGKA
ncbi:Uncharacterised protein [Moraxella caviae]|uniref:Uncharacterized protein n=1 Tax=Moraxella caviae TaxID=34060 RepID=A0A378R8E9_9GAMM|nr:hypothetical protein [Moraxella caviae]STZ14009.1 Uncharacterised protein [Moraxella caviae]STZ14475.1 Uncharacterised protein [Moraxella caviae]VEW12855.1 Uncharacterised protein [Moraxella caviae]